MEEREFNLKVTKICVIGLCFIIACFTSCIGYESALIKEMTNSGANPVEARCALGTSSSTLCGLYFASKK